MSASSTGARRPSSGRRPVSAVALRERVAAVLDALPERDRLVLSLRLVDGLSALEAAGALRASAREVEERTVAVLRGLAAVIGGRRALRRAA